jgi:hypothetical protein
MIVVEDWQLHMSATVVSVPAAGGHRASGVQIRR